MFSSKSYLNWYQQDDLETLESVMESRPKYVDIAYIFDAETTVWPNDRSYVIL